VAGAYASVSENLKIIHQEYTIEDDFTENILYRRKYEKLAFIQ